MNEDYVGTIVRGYSETVGCLRFHVVFDRHNYDEMKKGVKKALGRDGYNEFSAAKFTTAFNKIEPLVFRARFGREYSPVVYLTLKPDATDEDLETVKAAFKNTKYDEYAVGTDFPQDKCKVIRIWWD
jgi:hypothetical protein